MADRPHQSTSQQAPISPAAGVACVVLTLVGWSSVPLFLKHFSRTLDPSTSNGWRYGISALLWLPVLLVGIRRRNLPHGLWKAAVVPAVFNTLGQVCFTNGFYYIDPGLFTFGLRTQIVFVSIGAAVLFVPERRVVRSPGFIAGVAMVFLGACGALVLGTHEFKEATTTGVMLAVASGLLFACYGLSVRKFMHGMPPLVAFAAISQYTAAAMLGLMLVLGTRMGMTALDMSTGQFVLLLVSGLIGIAIGHVAYYYAIAKLGVAVSSGVIQLQPFLVAAGSSVLFEEQLTAGQWSAGLVAVGGAGLILWVQHRLSRGGAAEVEKAYESD